LQTYYWSDVTSCCKNRPTGNTCNWRHSQSLTQTETETETERWWSRWMYDLCRVWRRKSCEACLSDSQTYSQAAVLAPPSSPATIHHRVADLRHFVELHTTHTQDSCMLQTHNRAHTNPDFVQFKPLVPLIMTFYYRHSCILKTFKPRNLHKFLHVHLLMKIPKPINCAFLKNPGSTKKTQTQ